MRILLSWKKFWDEDIKYLMSRFEEEGHEVVYLIGHKKYTTADMKAVVHDVGEVKYFKPAEGINSDDFPPPNEDLIKQLYETESIILTMLTRTHGPVSIEERKHIYYSQLGYWHGVLKKYTPDVILFDDLPHSVHNYVLYAVARLLGIKTLMFARVRIGDRFLLFSDWRQMDQKLKKEFETIRNKNYKPSDLSLDVREVYESQAEAVTDNALYRNYSTEPQGGKKNPVWVTLLSLPNKVISAVHRIKDATFFEGVVSNIFQIQKAGLRRNLKKEYAAVQSEPDLEAPFVYLALHYQPERSTCPQGGAFVDQMLMIEILSASLPVGWKLYVKEHPRQWTRTRGNPLRCRRLGYYKDIAEMENVSIVPIEHNSIKLIRASQAIATATGTVGLEALLRLKTPIVFGHTWYKNFPGVFRVNNVLTCKAALLKIKMGYKPDKQEFLNFLKAFDTVGIRGLTTEKGTGGLSLDHSEKLSRKESMNNMIQASLEAFDE